MVNSKQLLKMLNVSWGLRQYPERKLFVIWSQSHLSKKGLRAKRKTLVDSIDGGRGQEPTLQVAPSYNQHSGHHLADEQIKQSMNLGSIVFHCRGFKYHTGLRVLEAPGIKLVCYKIKGWCVKKRTLRHLMIWSLVWWILSLSDITRDFLGPSDRVRAALEGRILVSHVWIVSGRGGR